MNPTESAILALTAGLAPVPAEVQVMPPTPPPIERSVTSAEMMALVRDGTVDGLEYAVRLIRGDERVEVMTRDGGVVLVDAPPAVRLRAAEFVAKIGIKAHELDAEARRDADRRVLSIAEAEAVKVRALAGLLRAAKKR